MVRSARTAVLDPCCYHITHRCQERRFLLRFKLDRRRYLERLREMSRRYPVAVLSYMVTSNHVHLLVWAKQGRHVARGMHFLQGTFAGDYNRRKEREGAFWRGRYHPTLVETGSHLSRCLFYTALNTVRAGACAHPSEWYGGAYDELTGQRRRYRILNRDRLLWCLGRQPEELTAFERWFEATVEEAIREPQVREPAWSKAAAVGSSSWLEQLTGGLRSVRVEPLVSDRSSSDSVAEDPGTHAAYAPRIERQALWSRLVR